MAPENRGHKSIVLGRTSSGFDARSAKTPFQAQSPKYGRSPLRTAMRALVVSSRSIDAIRRVNREAEGASEIAAVLDIWSPLFLGSGGSASLSAANLCIPDARNNRFVCIAAFWISHCSKNGLIRAPDGKKAAGEPAAFAFEGRGSRLLGGLLARRIERAGIVDLGNLVVGEAEHLAEDFVGVLAKQRRTGDVARAVRHLDGIADRKILAAGGVIDLDHGAGGAQRLILDQFLHRQDRTTGDVILVEDFHRFEF